MRGCEGAEASASCQTRSAALPACQRVRVLPSLLLGRVGESRPRPTLHSPITEAARGAGRACLRPCPLPCLPVPKIRGVGAHDSAHPGRRSVRSCTRNCSLSLASAALGGSIQAFSPSSPPSPSPLAALACPPVHWKRPSSLLHSEVIAFCL
jgi:hypothetical protein